MRDDDHRVGEIVGEKVQVRIVRRIGEGGMGTVYLAESTAAHLPYAVKLLQPRLCGNEAALRRFFREAIAASSVHHPGVINVVDVGRLNDGTGYYVMERLEGEDLATTLRREGRLSWPRVRHIALQICDAMAVVHAQDIVHRDLKPANCFRTTRGADVDAITILDFGLAKVAYRDVSTLTGEDSFLGTIPYMAPELLRAGGAREGDARADLWALGVMIQEMLTGSRPFRAPNVFQLLSVIQQQPPAPLDEGTTERDWPDGLGSVLARVLNKDPAGRYPDMKALAVALRELGGERARAHRPGPDSAVDAAASTVFLETPPDGARTVGGAGGPGSTPGPVDEEIARIMRPIRERSAFYVHPRSRWRPEPYELTNGANVVILRTDLSLEGSDALVCGITRDGPIPGTLAHRLCEFGGEEVAAVVDALPQLQVGSVHRVGGGRMAATHVFFAVLPDEFSGLAASQEMIARIASACLDRSRLPPVHSLSVPLFLSGAFGMPRRACLEYIIEAFSRCLARCPPFSLGMLRMVIDDDDGERLAVRGGVLTVELPRPRVREYERVQRFVLGRYKSTQVLGAAIWAAIPKRLRPALSSYGTSWILRHRQSGSVLAPALFQDSGAEGSAAHVPSLAAGSLLDLELLEEPVAVEPAEDAGTEADPEFQARCALIDWTLVTRGEQGIVPILCCGYRTTGDLLDDIWAAFPAHIRPLPYTYGTFWGLRERASGRLVPLEREASVPVEAAGFVPGSEFEVVWLT